MSEPVIVEELLKSNAGYAESSDLRELPIVPAKGLAILTCIDARIDVHGLLGLREGDALVLRNAGGIVTEDALRSLIISTELVGAREILVINHTDCGMQRFEDVDLRRRLKDKTGVGADHLVFHAFKDLRQNVREQVRTIRESPFIPKDIAVAGFILDLNTGRLEPVHR